MAADRAGRGGGAVDCQLGGRTVAALACRRREAPGPGLPQAQWNPSRTLFSGGAGGPLSWPRVLTAPRGRRGGRAGEDASRAGNWSFLARGECPPARSSVARPRLRPGASLGPEPAGLGDPGRGWRRGFQWRSLGCRERGRVCVFVVSVSGRSVAVGVWERWIFRSHPFIWRH